MRQVSLRTGLTQAGLARAAVWVLDGGQPKIHGLAEHRQLVAGTLLPSETQLDADAVVVPSTSTGTPGCPTLWRRPARRGGTVRC